MLSSLKVAKHLSISRSLGFGRLHRVVLQKREISNKSTKIPSHTIPLTEEFPGTPPLRPRFSQSGQSPPTLISTLSNGLRVATQETYGQASAVTAFIDVGTIYENEDNHGISVLLEKAAFKRTKKRNGQQVLSELENIGGHLNSNVNREFLIYAGEVLADRLPNLVEMMSDFIINPEFHEEDLPKQFETIAASLEEAFSNPEYILSEVLQDVAFKNSPLARSVLFPNEGFEKLNTSLLKNWHSSFFRPERIVIAGIGVEHDSFVQLIEREFKFPENSAISIPTPHSKYTGGFLALGEDQITFEKQYKLKDVSHLILGFEASSVHSPKMFASAVLQTLLGGGGSFSSGGPGKGMYSRLYRRVLNGLHYVENATAYHIAYKDTGLFGIYGAVEHNYLPHMIDRLCTELQLLAKQIEPEEFLRAKNLVKSTLLTSLESRSTLVDDIGRQISVYGHRKTPEEICAAIDELTIPDVQAVLKEILLTPPTLITYGKKPEKVPRPEIIHQYFKSTL